MMKCSQCDRPAMFKITEAEFPVCLNCHSQWSHTQDIAFLKNAVIMNHAMDSIDMSVGMGVPGDRMPINAIAKAIQGSPNLTNISVSNSQIGVLNTGAIQKIEAAITLSKGSDIEPLTTEIERLVQEIVDSSEIDQDAKNEAIELTEALAEEIVTKRRKPSAVAIAKGLKERLDGSLALASAAEKLWEGVKNLL